MLAVSIEYDHDREAKRAEIAQAVAQVDCGDGVVVVTDMFGGSPSNLSLPACTKSDRKVLYGANLPMLVKLAKCRAKPIEVAIECALNAGRKYINSCGGTAAE